MINYYDLFNEQERNIISSSSPAKRRSMLTMEFPYDKLGKNLKNVCIIFHSYGSGIVSFEVFCKNKLSLTVRELGEDFGCVWSTDEVIHPFTGKEGICVFSSSFYRTVNSLIDYLNRLDEIATIEKTLQKIN